MLNAGHSLRYLPRWLCPSHTLKLGLSLCFSLTACGGGTGTETQAAHPTLPLNVEQALRATEAAGQAPRLNRRDTVDGPDIDANGVRDDLDIYIDQLPDSPEQLAALRQEAKSITKMLSVNPENLPAVLDAAHQSAAATACLYTRYKPALAHQRSVEMEKFSVNTKIRFDAYMRFSKALSGQSTLMPRGDACVE